MRGVTESCLNAACHILGGELLGEDVHQPQHTTATYKSDNLLKQTINIDDMLQIENPNDVCAKKNIMINSSTDYINSNNTGAIDDDYELDF